MANYVEYIQLGAGGEVVPVRDPEAHLRLDNLDDSVNALGDSITSLPEQYAPAGYGLGTTATIITDLNTATETGFYYWTSSGINAPFNVSSGGGSMLVIKRNDNFVVQHAFDNTVANSSAMRTKQDGTWNDWEWVNPRMVSGVEYRTTERHSGRPVYKKDVYIGQLPASGVKYVPVEVSTYRVVGIECRGTHVGNHTISQFPLVSNGNIIAECFINNDSNLCIITYTDEAARYDCSCVISYLKY